MLKVKFPTISDEEYIVNSVFFVNEKTYGDEASIKILDHDDNSVLCINPASAPYFIIEGPDFE